jgi:nucleotide-binding universal stress UspA family protein
MASGSPKHHVDRVGHHLGDRPGNPVLAPEERLESEQGMSYSSIIVFVEADGAPDARVRLAAALADKFGSTLIGMSARAIPPPMVAGGMIIAYPTETDIMQMQASVVGKEAWFRRIAGSAERKLEWRSDFDFPDGVLAREARSADLVVIGRSMALGGRYSLLDPGEAILKMGRPTLVVPEPVATLRAEHVVIGWKDTREARRAVQDALLLLRQAARVTIVEACRPGEEESSLARLDDVVRYLARHGIVGVAKVMLEQKGSGAAQLIEVAQAEKADLLVTGAYGHSRLGEWMFGGMTRELLAISPICCLMSH